MVYTTYLREVGDSIMLTIPPALLVQLGLGAGSLVSIDIDRDRFSIGSAPPPRYTLEELIAATDPAALAASKKDIWMTGGPVGRELL
jgi:antitoxin ChpS